MIWHNVQIDTPDPSRDICVIKDYWKHYGYLSVEIIAGQIVFDNNGDWSLLNNDFIGEGSRMLYPITHRDPNQFADVFTYWAYCDEMPRLPDELYDDL